MRKGVLIIDPGLTVACSHSLVVQQEMQPSSTDDGHT